MAKYRKVDPKIWNDSKFRLLSERAKLIFFFLLTHPHMTALGAMRASLPGLAAEYGIQEKAFREAFAEASSKGMVKHDEKTSFLYLPNFLKYNRPESPNVIIGWAGAIDLLPECDMRNELFREVKAFTEALPKAFAEALPKAFAEALSKGMPYQEQEQEQEQELLPPQPPKGEDVSFLKFWQSYPRRVAKGDALKAWKKQRPPLEVVLSALDRQRSSHNWTKDGGQFIPHPATWINGRRWEDETTSGLAGDLAEEEPDLIAKIKAARAELEGKEGEGNGNGSRGNGNGIHTPAKSGS